jgi:hypothetical protein
LGLRVHVGGTNDDGGNDESPSKLSRELKGGISKLQRYTASGLVEGEEILRNIATRCGDVDGTGTRYASDQEVTNFASDV